MFFMARAAPPMLPAWLVLTSTTRMFCNDTMSLSKKTSGKLTEAARRPPSTKACSDAGDATCARAFLIEFRAFLTTSGDPCSPC